MNRELRLNGKSRPSTLLLSIVLFFCSPLLHAAANEVEQKGLGFGNTYQEALSSALLESVRQVRGLEAGTVSGLRFELNSITAGSSYQLNGKLQQTTDIYTQSTGWIKSYTIVDVKQPKGEGGNWQVTITAMIPQYQQAVADDKRQTIAVLPFHINQTQVKVDNAPGSKWKIATQLSSAIQSTLVRSQHYAVLNRNFASELGREERLWNSNRVNPHEASRLGEQLGADLMLLGHIDRFTLGHQSKAFYGADLGRQKAEITLSYQLIESATGKIIWSDLKQVFKPIAKNNNLFQQDSPHPLSGLISELGNEIATDILKQTAPTTALANITRARTPVKPEQPPVPERALTPGSSDKPWNW